MGVPTKLVVALQKRDSSKIIMKHVGVSHHPSSQAKQRICSMVGICIPALRITPKTKQVHTAYISIPHANV
jgi:hypothetical protein